MKISIDVPDGISGRWEVKTFEVSEEKAALFNLREDVRGTGRHVEAGTYKKLSRHGLVIMSNTPAEISDHVDFINEAKQRGGHILINGLGLGVALKEILKSEAVESVTVVEESQDVISLVATTYLKDSRVSIIEADAFEYEPPADKKYSAVWHDIWDSICSENLREMSKLCRKYRKLTDWQGCWAREECRIQKRKEDQY